MASHQTLQATKRDESGSAHSNRLRREGIVPAVVYGSEQRNYSIQIKNKDFSQILRQSSSENFLVNLEIEGADEKSKLAMVQDVQHNPLSGAVIHIDFHAVREDEILHAHVPIELHGEPVGVKEGGILEHMLRSIEVHCRPADLPEKIVHEIGELGLDESIHVSDLAFPDAVTTPMDGEIVVALCAESRAAVAAGTEEGEEEVAEGEEGEGEEGGEDEDGGE